MRKALGAFFSHKTVTATAAVMVFFGHFQCSSVETRDTVGHLLKNSGSQQTFFDGYLTFTSQASQPGIDGLKRFLLQQLIPDCFFFFFESF